MFCEICYELRVSEMDVLKRCFERFGIYLIISADIRLESTQQNVLKIINKSLDYLDCKNRRKRECIVL